MRASAAALGVLSLVGLNLAQAQSVDRARPDQYSRRAVPAPDVSVWIDRFSYRPGQRLRAFFQSDPGAFVTILRLSTTGDVRVLYPHTPSRQARYEMDRLVDDEVPYSSDLAFFVNEPEGVGFVFAVASYEPFDYRSVASHDRWNTSQLTRYGYADPYDVVSRFIDRTLPARAEYSTDYIQYQVVRELYYPRRYAYSNYNDLYYNCLTYRGYADYYCEQYARYGYRAYIPIFIARNPAPNPTPGTPGSSRPLVPGKMIPDPVAGDPGLENGTKPAQRSASKAETQRAWWNAQRHNPAGGGEGMIVNGSPRVDAQEPLPRVYRTVPAPPRIDVRPEPEYDPMQQRRVETREQPRYEPAPTGFKYDPPPQRRSEPPMQAAPVRIEPMRIEPPREYRPAPTPPPPPPPPAPMRSEPAPREPPPVIPSPPPPPPAAFRKIQ